MRSTAIAIAPAGWRLHDPTWMNASVPIGTMSTEVDDGALLQRWKLGDQASFRLLVERHQQRLLGIATCILADATDAADVVQEAFLRIVTHADSYDADRPFNAWSGTIVRRLAIDALRRRRVQNELVAEAHGITSAPGVALEAAELRIRVAEAMSDLPEGYREVLTQRELEGASPQDMARQAGIAEDTMRWRIHKARTLFRAAWTRRFGEGWP